MVSAVINYVLWLLRIAIIVIVVAMLLGCATNRGPLASGKTIKDFYCGNDTQPGAYVPVRWSREDTDETIAQNKANNAVYVDTCR